jgi:hypothetical protein
LLPFKLPLIQPSGQAVLVLGGWPFAHCEKSIGETSVLLAIGGAAGVDSFGAAGVLVEIDGGSAGVDSSGAVGEGSWG